MNILFCGDEGIKNGVAVSILSFMMNGEKHNLRSRKHNPAFNRGEKNHNSTRPIYNIYIATIKYKEVKPFSRETVKALDALVKKYNPKNSVTLIDATKVFVDNLPQKNMGSYFTPCSMLRLYMDRMPELSGLDRILYLDYDVVCRGNIGEFYDTDLDGVEAAGVLDIYGKNFYHYRGLFNFDYMNSGVMLFNLEECRKTKCLEKAVEFCAKRRMMLADQAALNKAIEKRKLMPRKYNEQGERPRGDTVLHHFSNNFKFWPVFRVQKVKPHQIDKVHEILGITEYDDIYAEYLKVKGQL